MEWNIQSPPYTLAQNNGVPLCKGKTVRGHNLDHYLGAIAS